MTDDEGPRSSITDDSLLRAVARAPDGAPRRDPERLLHFRVLGRIGEGGMGIVYKAVDEKLGREVALKLLPAEVSADPDHRRRFEREARAVAALKHPNIVTMYSVEEGDGHVFFAMELVDGETVADAIPRGGMSPAELLAVALPLVSAVAAAHEQGIVHRDLKPRNVMRTARGEIKVLDFGLAKLAETVAGGAGGTVDPATASTTTAGGRIAGTPAYMSPEQAEGRPIDARSDIFSLGVTLYEMASGERPFKGATTLSLISSLLRDEPVALETRAPGTPRELARIVRRCLAKDPAHRYPSARELGDDLGALAAKVKSGRPLPRLRGGVRAAVSVAAAFALLAGLVLAARPRGASTPAAPPASREPADAPVAVTALPPPATGNADALAAYRSSLQSLRDASITVAAAGFSRAVSLDETLAAARVQLLLIGDVGSLDDQRNQAAVAWKLRATLSPRDAAVLEVAKGDVALDTPDLGAEWDRWRALAARFPRDAEIACAAGQRAAAAGRADDARALLRTALDLDPKFAWPHQVLAGIALGGGDLDGAIEAAAHCLTLSPSAASCLSTRAEVESRRGQCAELEKEARRMIGADPNDAQAYEWLSDALTSLGAPAESIVQARLRSSELAFTPSAKAARRVIDPTVGPWLVGDFTGVAAHFREWDAVRTTTTSEGTARGMTFGELYTYEEMGDAAHLLAVAEDYLNRASAFTQDELAAGEYFALAIRHRARRVGDAELRATRDAWIRQGLQKMGPQGAGEVWFMLYAQPVRTPEEAREALEALPRFSPLPAYEGEELTEYIMGNVLFLAGDLDGALPHLRRATTACFNLFGMTERVRAAEELGEVLEAKGDKEGACGAYGQVLARWGHARPRSITADAARPRARRLGCAVAP